MHPAAQPPHPHIPPWPRRVRKVGAPLAVLIGLGAVTGLLIILLTLTNPVGAAIGFVLSTVAIAVVVLSYLWLDRWEPEPPRLLHLAFIWGRVAGDRGVADRRAVVRLGIRPPVAGLPEASNPPRSVRRSSKRRPKACSCWS